MRYLYYLGCTFLAGLLLVLLPKNVAMAEAAAPTVTGVSPVEIVINAIPSPYLTIQGNNWPNEMYGLDAYLMHPTSYERITLEVLSYTPLNNRMIVQLPYWGKYEATTYNLVVSTRNGLRGVLENAIRVVGEPTSGPSEGITAPEGGGAGEKVVSPQKPSTSTSASSTEAPGINIYSPDVIEGPYAGVTIIFLGYNWPNEMYGLQGYLLDTESWKTFPLETLSYTPLSGRMIAQTPILPDIGPKAYDIVLSTRSGLRTTIHNGLWVAN